MTLEIKERTLAHEEGRAPVDIKEDDVEAVFEACDIDHDGNLNKDEMQAWLLKYMKSKPEEE
jgi:Ca2+-binding EF-hand superfamily protein